MKELVFVVGDVGTGKTASMFPNKELEIEGLDPKETLLISVYKNPAVKKWRSLYTPLTKDGGNFLKTSSAQDIVKTFEFINSKRPDIKNIVIDDGQYIMGFDYMHSIYEKGYDKFNRIGYNMFSIVEGAEALRDDIIVFFIIHSEQVTNGLELTYKMRTVGRLLDEKINLEGMTNVCLYSNVVRGEDKPIYQFVTNRDGIFPARSPMGMFPSLYIPNDLGLVKKCIDDYVE